MTVTTPDPTADMQIYSETEDARHVRLSEPAAKRGLLTGDGPLSHLRYPCSA